MIYTEGTKHAMKLLYQYHEGQVDKAGIPYVFHPIHVAEQMDDETSTIVALLHDVVEDTDKTIEDLRNEGFSETVLETIQLLSRPKGMDYQTYILRIAAHPLARKVKIADLKHNSMLSRLDVVKEDDWKRFRKYRKCLEYLENLEIETRYDIQGSIHALLSERIREGDICVDATMGNGSDTLFLSEKVGPYGRVYAYDIQQEALNHTGEKLKCEGSYENYRLFLKSHDRMDEDLDENTASCILFNLGYLPGGDHSIATVAKTSIAAIGKGLDILVDGGILCVCIYSGGDSGMQEHDEVLEFLQKLPRSHYTVISTKLTNTKGNAPLPVFVYKKYRPQELAL